MKTKDILQVVIVYILFLILALITLNCITKDELNAISYNEYNNPIKFENLEYDDKSVILSKFRGTLKYNIYVDNRDNTIITLIEDNSVSNNSIDLELKIYSNVDTTVIKQILN